MIVLSFEQLLFRIGQSRHIFADSRLPCRNDLPLQHTPGSLDCQDLHAYLAETKVLILSIESNYRQDEVTLNIQRKKKGLFIGEA